MVDGILGPRRSSEALALKSYSWRNYPLLHDLFRMLERQEEEIRSHAAHFETFFRTLNEFHASLLGPAREVLATRRIAPARLGFVLSDQRKQLGALAPPGESPLSFPEDYWSVERKFDDLIRSLGPLLVDRISQGDVVAVRALLEIHEVPTYFEDAKGRSLMQVGIESGVPRMVALLCRNRLPAPKGYLEKAIREGNEPAVRTIIGSGEWHFFSKDGDVDFHGLAVALGRPEVIAFQREAEPSQAVLAAGRNRPKVYGPRLGIAKLLNSVTQGTPNALERNGLMAAAVFFGTTRLIDNVELD
jgi:hypothetical protein